MKENPHVRMFFEILLGVFLLFSIVSTVPAQQRLHRSVVGNGAVASEGAGALVRGTVGQPLIGSSRIAQMACFSGFWYRAEHAVVDVEPDVAAPPGNFILAGPYPNPAVDRVHVVISLPAGTVFHIALFDELGRRMLARSETMTSENRRSLDIAMPAGLPPGHYRLVVRWKGGIRGLPLTIFR